jgi:hypothetical protein
VRSGLLDTDAGMPVEASRLMAGPTWRPTRRPVTRQGQLLVTHPGFSTRRRERFCRRAPNKRKSCKTIRRPFASCKLQVASTSIDKHWQLAGRRRRQRRTTTYHVPRATTSHQARLAISSDGLGTAGFYSRSDYWLLVALARLSLCGSCRSAISDQRSAKSQGG